MWETAMPDELTSPRFLAALRAFDDANAGDPNREFKGGVEEPRELVYARRLTSWVLALKPDASEALRLAARCQHLCRWEIPRETYPSDRAGYLRWRRELQQFHARKSGEMLAAVGYDPATIARVQALNLKQDLATDPECQVLEDALCLVFLQYQLTDLGRRMDEEKLIGALRKAWGKMSPAGRDAARTIEFGERERGWVAKAVGR